MAHEELLYLRPDIQVEPLVDQWYAWPHLISPATAARNITERNLRIMDSYISTPSIHANAVSNPKMRGGPFIDYQGRRVDEIRALRDKTRHERAEMMAFSAAITSLDDILHSQAQGYSLHPVYGMVPECLRGYVELLYDLNNAPSFRLIEPLLYRSRFHQPKAQSLMLSITLGDDRPFALSTPRLGGQGLLHLRVPFEDPRIDILFRARRHPTTWAALGHLFELTDAEALLFRSFFTTSPPVIYQPYQGLGVRWRYFGHACILIETRDVRILVDPVLSYTYEAGISRYTYEDLPDEIDYVLVTHTHQDHVLMETLLQLRSRVHNVVVPRSGSGALQDPSLKLMLRSCGFRNVIELGEFELLMVGNGSIKGLPFLGEHSDLAVSSKLAYFLSMPQGTFLFAADSCNIEPKLYDHIRHDTGPVDILFLGMECDGAPLSWLYGSLLTRRIERGKDDSRRLSGSDFAQGRELVDRLGCKHVYIYAMGQEPWLNYVMSIKYTEQSRPILESNRLIDYCRARGIVSERLFGEKEIICSDSP